MQTNQTNVENAVNLPSETAVNPAQAEEETTMKQPEEKAQIEGEMLQEFLDGKRPGCPDFILGIGYYYAELNDLSKAKEEEKEAIFDKAAHETVGFLRGYYREGEKISYGDLPDNEKAKRILGSKRSGDAKDRILGFLKTMEPDKDELMEKCNLHVTLVDKVVYKAKHVLPKVQEATMKTFERIDSWCVSTWDAPVELKDDEKPIPAPEKEGFYSKCIRKGKNTYRKFRHIRRNPLQTLKKAVAGIYLAGRAIYHFCAGLIGRVVGFFSGLFSTPEEA